MNWVFQDMILGHFEQGTKETEEEWFFLISLLSSLPPVHYHLLESDFQTWKFF